jgi:hypothetical protein
MWNNLAEERTINKTAAALKENGMEVVVVKNSEAARQEIEKLIPDKAEVMMMTSMTLEETGVTDLVSHSDRYVDIHGKLVKMDRSREAKIMRQMRSAPEYSLGSVQAVTTDGKLVMASNTGSQLPAYAAGAGRAVFVVGTQKIVADLDTAFRRIYEYVLPLESERAKKAYRSSGSNVSKLLVINKEVIPGRITVILVKQKLGF